MIVRIILGYLVLINIVTFVTYGVDKLKAKKQCWRIPESTLIGLGVIGGSLGALIGMQIWHHKTQHNVFRFGIPFVIVLQITSVLLYLILNSKI